MSGVVGSLKDHGVAEVRQALLAARAAAERSAAEASRAQEILNRVFGAEQLAMAVKALRTIANNSRSDDYARGVASGALLRIGEKVKR